MDIELIFNILASFVFGTLIGSFLNVVIWRLPRESGLGGRSHCPNCHRQLRSFELLPLLSYLSSRGKCRQCGKPISLRYPAIETITGLLFVTAWLSIEPSISSLSEWLIFAKALLVISTAIVIFVIDFEHYLILNRVLVPVGFAVLGLSILMDVMAGNSFANSHVISGLIGSLGAGVMFFLIWYASKGKWMGFGDVKLVILLGFIFGYAEMAMLLLLAFWLGLIVSLGLLASGRASMGTKLPFGTFLSASAIIILFYGQEILRWYMGLVGFPIM